MPVAGAEGVSDLIALDIFCKGQTHPDKYVFLPDDAERTAQALLDSVARYRRGEGA